MTDRFAAARAVIERAVEARAFPAAVVEVGTGPGVAWRQAFGRLTFSPDADRAQEETVFDLASLTKVLATAPALMRLVERGTVDLDEPVAGRVPAWRDVDPTPVTIRDLLSHAGGLAAHAPLFLDHSGRRAFEPAICDLPRAYPARSAAVYSDLGFMLLGFVADDQAGLEATTAAVLDDMAAGSIRFLPPDAWRTRTAPTRRDDWRGRLLVGEVDDNNAWALGGIAGHAGLFGTVGAVGACARHLLRILDGADGAFRRETLRTFVTRRAEVPGSSRALGWDTMVATSSCGTRMSAGAFGHTGFTGTSLWIDPDRGVYVVLLTNRIHPTPDNDTLLTVRPAFHDAVMGAV